MTALVTIMERASAGAYGEDSALIGKLAGLFNSATFDKTWGPFICGADGEAGSDGLHESYAICPCYGADVRATRRYVRT